MQLLLDTHAFIWWWADSPRLGKRAREAIAEAEIVFVSVASAWEIAIKQTLGRLRFGESTEIAVFESGLERLPIAFAHAEAVARLPLHHQDPFDRMLIAQAQLEGLAIATRDRHFDAYDVRLVAV